MRKKYHFIISLHFIKTKQKKKLSSVSKLTKEIQVLSYVANDLDLTIYKGK